MLSQAQKPPLIKKGGWGDLNRYFALLSNHFRFPKKSHKKSQNHLPISTDDFDLKYNPQD